MFLSHYRCRLEYDQIRYFCEKFTWKSYNTSKSCSCIVQLNVIHTYTYLNVHESCRVGFPIYSYMLAGLVDIIRRSLDGKVHYLILLIWLSLMGMETHFFIIPFYSFPVIIFFLLLIIVISLFLSIIPLPGVPSSLIPFTQSLPSTPAQLDQITSLRRSQHPPTRLEKSHFLFIFRRGIGNNEG